MKVLFVCSGNAFRSPVAEALLKKFRSDVEVESAGTNPVIPVSQAARNYLSKVGGRKYLKKSPEGIDEKELQEYSLIVAMEKNHKEDILRYCPECLDKIVVWNIIDPYFMPYENTDKVFNLIKKKVEELAESL